MKFLIAASFLCLALVGQIQGGSLRGLIVPVPHQYYGPSAHNSEIQVEESKPIVEEKDSTIIEAGKEGGSIVTVPSSEYGAPGMSAEVQASAFVDSLPLVDSVANFGTPTMELPYLKPGFPDLPEAPVVPVIAEEPIREVSNTYLPPATTTTTAAPIMIEEYKPSTMYGSPTIAEFPAIPPTPFIPAEVKPSEVYGPPEVLTTIPESPKLPEFVPSPEEPMIAPTPIVEDVKEGYTYDKPQGVPTFELPKVTIHAPVLPQLTEEIKPVVLNQASYIEPAVAQVHIAPDFIGSRYVDYSSVRLPESHFVVLPEQTGIPLETAKEGYTYSVPSAPLSTPISHGVVSHTGFTQNVASSLSSSSLQLNNYIVPGHVQTVKPLAATGDSVIVEQLTPTGPAFAFQALTGNSKETSVGTFNHVSLVNHGLAPLTTYFPTAGEVKATFVPTPHSSYGPPA